MLEKFLTAHDTYDEHLLLIHIVTIENAARPHDQLPISGTPGQFWNLWPQFRRLLQQISSLEDLLHKLDGRLGLVQSDVFGNPFQVIQRQLAPDHFNHLAIRFLACDCVKVRPS